MCDMDYTLFWQETYGDYAELRHTAEQMMKEGHLASEDIKAQKEYMDSVCRSYASRIERRRNLIITSVRFHRLAEEVNRLRFAKHIDSCVVAASSCDC